MARDLSARMTYEDYVALPNDGQRYEIHDGEVSVTPAPGTRHQGVSIRLASLLFSHVSARALGEVYNAPVDVILDRHTIVQPEIVFVAGARLGIVAERGIEGAPTLVVEILSASTARIDRATKFQLYARFGVPHYWIVDPEARTVEAYALGASGYGLALHATGSEPVSPPPFEGLALVPASLWPAA